MSCLGTSWHVCTVNLHKRLSNSRTVHSVIELQVTCSKWHPLSSVSWKDCSSGRSTFMVILSWHANSVSICVDSCNSTLYIKISYMIVIMSNYMPVNMSFCAAATAKLHHTGMMLCVLMFIFCLIGLLPEIHSGRSLVAFSDVMTLLEVPHPMGPSVLHWLRPNFPSQRLGDLASKDLEMHGKWKFEQTWWHVDL